MEVNKEILKLIEENKNVKTEVLAVAAMVGKYLDKNNVPPDIAYPALLNLSRMMKGLAKNKGIDLNE